MSAPLTTQALTDWFNTLAPDLGSVPAEALEHALDGIREGYDTSWREGRGRTRDELRALVDRYGEFPLDPHDVGAVLANLVLLRVSSPEFIAEFAPKGSRPDLLRPET
jgi:hypothetical protein